MHRTILLSILLLLALTACAGQPSPAAAPPRTLTVIGSGLVEQDPDIATVYVSVNSEHPAAEQAVSENNQRVQALMDTLQSAGIAPEDITTSNFSIWMSTPYEVYDGTGEAPGNVYTVSNSVSVTVRDISALGSILDQIVAAGASSISYVAFDVSDKSESEKQARALAVEDARAQAEELAAAAGVELGELLSITYPPVSQPSYSFDARAMGVGGGGGTVPIEPGSVQMSSSVQLIFAIR